MYRCEKHYQAGSEESCPKCDEEQRLGLIAGYMPKNPSTADVPVDELVRLVTVCDSCLQASCWQGVFMCDNAQTAGTVEKTVAELTELALEHPDYWEEA